ncbi:hypothetical protein TCAL_15065, partial [Tigriopus californicus]
AGRSWTPFLRLLHPLHPIFRPPSRRLLTWPDPNRLSRGLDYRLAPHRSLPPSHPGFEPAPDQLLVNARMPLRLDIKRRLTARSDRVKCVDLHPSEPWMLASLYNGNV